MVRSVPYDDAGGVAGDGAGDGAGADIVVQGDAAFVLRSLPAAVKRLRLSGLRLRLPSSIIVDDDVFAFVTATGQTNPGLRAWSTLQTVHLLPPSTWRDAGAGAIEKRLTHELCHLSLWQESTTPSPRLPRFVVEGFCSVVADQGDSRQPVDQVLGLLAAGRSLDFEGDSTFSYGLAHHVFAAVLRCRGGPGLKAVVDAIAAGTRVEAALGATPQRWLQEPCPDSALDLR